jgi:HK97 family phage major capsid protein
MKTLLDLVRDERAKLIAPADEVIAKAEAEERNLSAEEFDVVTRTAAATADIDERIAALTAKAERDAAAARQLPTVGGGVVRTEARTYNPDASRQGVSFFGDILAKREGDFDAAQRLARHMSEERVERPGIEARAVATGAFSGLVVPQYLTELVAPRRRAGRPFANIMNNMALPASGMTVEISRITTGTSAAIQTQNAGASETDTDDTLLSVPVLTAAGQQTASIQAIQRGTGIDRVIAADLLSSVETLVDSTIINQATTGLNAVTDANLDIAYTDASPTAAELWPKLFDAIQQVQTNHFGGVSHFVMHPRRFWWLASNVGTSFPFVNLVGAGAQSGGSVAGTGYGEGPSGFLAGLPVIVDANCATNLGAGTNEDAIYAVSADECHLWEDDAVFITARETAAASLGVLFVAYKFFAYTVSRYPNANARINGTGLVTPTY